MCILLINRCLRSNEHHSLVALFKQFILSAEAYSRHHHAGRKGYEEGELIPRDFEKNDFLRHSGPLMHFLLGSLLILAHRKEIIEAPIEPWKTDAKRIGFSDENLENWFDCVSKSASKSTSKSTSELVAVMQNDKDESGIRSVAALLLSTQDSIAPNQCFYANVLLVYRLSYLPLPLYEVEDVIEMMIAKNWRKIVTEQRFAILSPKINAPAIVSACDDSSYGFKKAARILLAAKDAVRIPVQEEILQQLKKLAQS